MRARTAGLCALLFWLLASCTTITRIGSHDAAPIVPIDAAIPCGPTSCYGGEVCCNVSCGTCRAPGMTCNDITCADGGGSPCSGDDATLLGGGACSRMLYRWDGDSCQSLAGCECIGRDCDRLKATVAECFEEHTACWDHACQTAPDECPEGHFCEVPVCTETTGTCVRSPTTCTDFSEPVVCGCDGAPYTGTCDARQSRVSHDASEACDLCAPNVPIIGGSCSTMLGFAWDGGRCAPIRGCMCTDACDRLYPTVDACTLARAPCLTFACEGIRCSRFVEICLLADTGTRCDPLPGICEGVPSCSCMGDDVMSCTEAGPGAFIVTPS